MKKKPVETNQPRKGEAVLEGLIDTKYPVRLVVAYPFTMKLVIPVKGGNLVFILDKILDIPVYHNLSGVMSRMFPKARYIFEGIDS